jgi:hypothetical protein
MSPYYYHQQCHLEVVIAKASARSSLFYKGNILVDNL